jgi:hypothetical protein
MPQTSAVAHPAVTSSQSRARTIPLARCKAAKGCLDTGFMHVIIAPNVLAKRWLVQEFIFWRVLWCCNFVVAGEGGDMESRYWFKVC